MNEPAAPKLIEHFFTVDQFLAAVPLPWRGAPLVVGDDSFDKCYAVKRIALHRNAGGSQVVVIYTKETHRERK